MKKLKKKVFLSLGLLLFFTTVNSYRGFINTPAEKCYNYILVSLSLSGFYETDSTNTPVNAGSLRTLFIETIYNILVIEKLQFQKVLDELISRPFARMWLTLEFLFFAIKEFVVLSSGYLKFILARVKIFVEIPLFILSTLIALTHLRTRFIAPLVLRC